MEDSAAPNACQQGCVWHGHLLDILTVRAGHNSHGAPGLRSASSFQLSLVITFGRFPRKGETHNNLYIIYQTCYFVLLLGKTIHFDFDIVSTGLKQPTSSRRNIRNICSGKDIIGEMRGSCCSQWCVVHIALQFYEPQKYGKVI